LRGLKRALSGAAKFEEISPADFFYRYRDIAGFSNPTRALFSAIREMVENALDACEAGGILPDIYLRLSLEEEREGASIYRLHIEDNGSGVPGSTYQGPLDKSFTAPNTGSSNHVGCSA